MIIPGVTSATTRSLSIEETIEAALRGGLKGIEWEALKHVRPGDVQAADKARELCAESGLKIPSYGSYYKAGVSEKENMRFKTVLETCKALGAPMIRIWAGNKDYDQSGVEHIKGVVEDTLRIADLAAAEGVGLIFEFHGGTLTDSADHARLFAAEVDHTAVTFSWQPPPAVSDEDTILSLEKMLSRLSTLHIFQWDMGPYLQKGYTRERYMQEGLFWYRQSLVRGAALWKKLFNIAERDGRDHWALLEFSADDSVEQFVEDSKTLISLIGK